MTSPAALPLISKTTASPLSSLTFRHGLRLSLLALAALLLGGCSQDYNWGWYVVDPTTKTGLNNLKFLISGISNTVQVSLIAIAISMAVGLMVALPGITENRVLRSVNRVYVEVFRSIPVLVMILWTYYGLPILLGFELGVFWAAVLALALCDSAFQAEIFRAGIQSISKGQHEAAESLGLTYLQKMYKVVLPQALRVILPPLGNQFVYMLKMSSLASIIGLTELTRRANELNVVEYRALEIYSILVLEYMLLILAASWLVRRMEKRMAQADARKTH
ncbi:amino acid ABC transporter permease [Kiloniella sp. b19]|uniref:amino acid ABC transporter permease n=1 Tax=Kiloniella sp. GXU_MW_B19 TaxID=3141326 RepID=UPI0031CE1D29